MTEKGFLAKRRRFTLENSSEVTLTKAQEIAREGCKNIWNDELALEQAWQQTKQYKSRVQAKLEGILLESEIDEELVDVAEKFQALQQQQDQDRVKGEKKGYSNVDSMFFVILYGRIKFDTLDLRCNL